MKTVLKVVISVVVVLGLLIGGGAAFLFWGMSGTQKLAINAVDLANVADGSYMGSYRAGRWSNDVTVQVKDHKIVSVNVDKDVTVSLPEVKNGVVEEIIKAQSPDVDIVSSSTVTSKAYMKAVENALSVK